MSFSNQNVPAEILTFCNRCSDALAGMTDHMICIDFIRSELPKLVKEKRLFTDLMKNLVQGAGYPDIRFPTMFDNEVVLYADARRLFSLRMYLWGPKEATFAHDHNSWGVIVGVTDGFEVINYKREDDGTREGYARLVESQRLVLRAGETAYTLPFDKGIHKTGNPGDQTVTTLHLYGRAKGRGYLQGFDVEKNRVYKVFPQKLKKELLAVQALAALEQSGG